jgi:gamma-glutamyl:cysteine ligase YbdK (ATP-grasp superfamily)
VSGSPAGAHLRVIDASASPEEVAAIVAALTAALGSSAAPADVAPGAPASDWRTASRLRARRVGVLRGEWRRSERMGGRVPT